MDTSLKCPIQCSIVLLHNEGRRTISQIQVTNLLFVTVLVVLYVLYVVQYRTTVVWWAVPRIRTRMHMHTHNRTAIYLISLRMDGELPNREILYTVVRRVLRFIFPKGPSSPRRVESSNICRSSNTSRKLVPVACNLNLSVQSILSPSGENVDGLQEMNHE